MRVRVLGPVEAGDGHAGAPVGSRSQRMVLAVLASRPGETVSADVLVDALWGDDPPRTAAHTLRTYVSRLRNALGDAVAIGPGGYVLTLGDDEVDAGRFEALTGEASRGAGLRQSGPHRRLFGAARRRRGFLVTIGAL